MEENSDETIIPIIKDWQNYFLFPRKILKVYGCVPFDQMTTLQRTGNHNVINLNVVKCNVGDRNVIICNASQVANTNHFDKSDFNHSLTIPDVITSATDVITLGTDVLMMFKMTV